MGGIGSRGHGWFLPHGWSGWVEVLSLLLITGRKKRNTRLNFRRWMR
jgi:hypothetical protein